MLEQADFLYCLFGRCLSSDVIITDELNLGAQANVFDACFVDRIISDNVYQSMAQHNGSVAKLAITSPAFESGGEIPEKYTCNGDDLIPPLNIGNIPKETKSLALIMEDPDVPKGTWYHWIKWNIPPNTTKIDEGEEPVGVPGEGSSGNHSYEGPCPPSGRHHYHFRFFALDAILELDEGVSKSKLDRAMQSHIIAQGELVGVFGTEAASDDDVPAPVSEE